jgi:hypothetical protein
MAGYSGTPLLKKLGIKPGHTLCVVGAPASYQQKVLGRLPTGVTVKRAPKAPLDVIHFFTSKRANLEERFARLAAVLAPDGMIWISWPKKTSGVVSDVSEDIVRQVGLDAGLVDVKVCAVDDTWSGLKFVRRLQDR